MYIKEIVSVVVKLMQVSQVRDQWRALVDIIMKLRAL
jgi:hypothetical protein